MDYLLLIMLALLLACSAFFSGSETALMSLNAVRLRWMKSEGRDVQAIESFLSHPARALATILIGNLVVNLLATTVATSVAVRFWGAAGVGIAIAVMSLLLVLFGEISPKIIAMQNAERIARWITPPLRIFGWFITPFRIALMMVSDRLIWFISGGRVQPEAPITEDDLKTLVEIGHEHGAMNQMERQMIHSVLRYTDVMVDSVMVPRVDMQAAPDDLTEQEIRRFLIKTRHSKIPVYHDSLDKITGILYAKDALIHPETPYRNLLLPPLFVPDTARLHQVFHQLQTKKRRLAIIVDEYGGTVGIVTMEDLVEEVFGEIYDEFERPEFAIRKIHTHAYRVRGNLTVHELNDTLNLNLPEDEYDTVAGLMIGVLERLPGVGETVVIGQVKLRAEHVRDNRIQSITVYLGRLS